MRMLKVRQNPKGEHSYFDLDVAAAVKKEMPSLVAGVPIAGKSIAVTAGSRGISQIPLIVRAAVDFLKEAGANPFIIPGMGSHGGSTAEGQLKVLESLGITPETMGVEIRSSMDVVLGGETSREKMPVWMDKNVHGADYLLVINRVKAHTIFLGTHGSGLLKMLTIGLGKLKGAKTVHSYTKRFSFDSISEGVHDVYQAWGKLLGGLAVVENSQEKTGLIQAVLPADFATEDARLQRLAREWMPRIPVKDIDLLIVDEMGKDISGSGMDPNIIGRTATEHWVDGQSDGIRRIYVRDLTEKTHGNAVGIGYADACAERLVAKIDRATTYTNALTGGMPSKVAIPMTFKTDREAIEAMIGTVPCPDNPRIVWIKNTADLGEILLSDNIGAPLGCDVIGEVELAYDTDGSLL